MPEGEVSSDSSSSDTMVYMFLAVEVQLNKYLASQSRSVDSFILTLKRNLLFDAYSQLSIHIPSILPSNHVI